MANTAPKTNLPDIPKQYFSEQDLQLLEACLESGIRKSKSAFRSAAAVHQLYQKIAGVQQLLDELRNAPARAKAQKAAERDAKKNQASALSDALEAANGPKPLTPAKRKVPRGVH